MPRFEMTALIMLFICLSNSYAEQEVKPMFRTGIDANYWLYLATNKYDSTNWDGVAWKDENSKQKWYDSNKEVSLFKYLHEKGVDAFRIRLWVNEDGPSGLRYATEIAHAAQDNGLKPYLVIFLSDKWTDISKQPMPTIWNELNTEELKSTVYQYSKRVTEHFQKEGIDIDMYEIGNETDFGICGVFPPSLDNLSEEKRMEYWAQAASIMKSCISGIKDANPNGKIMLHIAVSWSYDFALGYFKFMDSNQVPFDYIGLSYYPSSPVMQQFRITTIEAIDSLVNRLYSQLKRPIFFPEYAFPHTKDQSHAFFKDWNNPVYGYEATLEGQKSMLRTFLNWARKHPHIYGAYYWSPEWYIPKDKDKGVETGWAPMCLFATDGNALPAVDSFAR